MGHLPRKTPGEPDEQKSLPLGAGTSFPGTCCELLVHADRQERQSMGISPLWNRNRWNAHEYGLKPRSCLKAGMLHVKTRVVVFHCYHFKRAAVNLHSARPNRSRSSVPASSPMRMRKPLSASTESRPFKQEVSSSQSTYRYTSSPSTCPLPDSAGVNGSSCCGWSEELAVLYHFCFSRHLHTMRRLLRTVRSESAFNSSNLMELRYMFTIVRDSSNAVQCCLQM